MFDTDNGVYLEKVFWGSLGMLFIQIGLAVIFFSLMHIHLAVFFTVSTAGTAAVLAIIFSRVLAYICYRNSV